MGQVYPLTLKNAKKKGRRQKEKPSKIKSNAFSSFLESSFVLFLFFVIFTARLFRRSFPFLAHKKSTTSWRPSNTRTQRMFVCCSPITLSPRKSFARKTFALLEPTSSLSRGRQRPEDENYLAARIVWILICTAHWGFGYITQSNTWEITAEHEQQQRRRRQQQQQQR